jgi:hypothetical protein
MILPLIYLILLHGSRHKKIPPWLPERDYFGSRSWRVSRKIKAVIAKNWYYFFAIFFFFCKMLQQREQRCWFLEDDILALHFGLNRFGKEKNRAKINRFELVFGSVQKLKIIIIYLVVYFDPKPDRTENAQP